jgi:hypothetical protein
MHDAAYAAAALPVSRAVFGLPLLAYSVGHELVLTRQGNAFATGGDPTREDLAEAVLVCSQTWEEFHNPGPWFKLGVRLWLWRMRKADHLKPICDFYEYKNAGSSEPQVEPEPLKPGETQAREAGAPFLLRLILFLRNTMRMTEAEAMNHPYGHAKWLAAAHWESEHGLRIANRHEIEFANWIEEQERLNNGEPDNLPGNQ